MERKKTVIKELTPEYTPEPGHVFINTLCKDKSDFGRIFQNKHDKDASPIHRFAFAVSPTATIDEFYPKDGISDMRWAPQPIVRVDARNPATQGVHKLPPQMVVQFKKGKDFKSLVYKHTMAIEEKLANVINSWEYMVSYATSKENDEVLGIVYIELLEKKSLKSHAEQKKQEFTSTSSSSKEGEEEEEKLVEEEDSINSLEKVPPSVLVSVATKQFMDMKLNENQRNDPSYEDMDLTDAFGAEWSEKYDCVITNILNNAILGLPALEERLPKIL
jgi:hypothetical protein